jgi:hypothetical protein
MTDRDLDRQLVERAQRGDKHAFELLVSKYQRKLSRLLARFIRDAGGGWSGDLYKAYQALPSFRSDAPFCGCTGSAHGQELPGSCCEKHRASSTPRPGIRRWRLLRDITRLRTS